MSTLQAESAQVQSAAIQARPGTFWLSLERQALAAFTISLLGNALAAYNIGPFPVPWIAQCTTIVFVLYLVFSSRRMLLVPGLSVLMLFVLWASVVTVANSFGYDYGHLMPHIQTTSYHVFVILRFLNILAAGAQIYLTYWLLVHCPNDSAIRSIVFVGTLVAMAAIYVYAAQTLGLPEPTRTRMGTGGGEQATTFTYAFHRAMGTFREPGEMASWLILPFILSCAVGGRMFGTQSVLMGCVVLVSGSLSAIVGSILGFGITMVLFFRPGRYNRGQQLVKVCAVVGMSSLAFSLIAVANEGGGTNLFDILSGRVERICDGGILGSNRAYVYEYYLDTNVPILGVGLGNSNLLFAQYLECDTVTSFLSLYLNVAYSTGIVGLVILAYWLLIPVYQAFKACSKAMPQKERTRLTLITAAYMTWLVMCVFRSEEPTMMFGVSYAVLAHAALRIQMASSSAVK